MDPLKGASNNLIQISNHGKGPGVKREDFMETLKTFYFQVDKSLKEADQKVGEFAVGKRYDLHEIMIATEKAGISFKFLLQIRNKLLEAYQEIMRMQF